MDGGSSAPTEVSSREAIDRKHLRLLSIFYYISGGLQCFTTLIVILYLVLFGTVFGIAIIGESSSSSQQTAPSQLGGIHEAEEPNLLEDVDDADKANDKVAALIILIFFFVILSLIALASIACTAAQFYAGYYLRRHQRRLFAFYVGCLNLLFIPLGFILGIFTIIVLSRESVKQLYERTDP